MKKIWILGAALTFAACSGDPAVTSDKSDEKLVKTARIMNSDLYSHDMAKFVGLEIGQSLEESVNLAVDYTLPDGEEDLSTSDIMQNLDDPENIQVLVTQYNLMDDSVQDLQIRLVYKQVFDGREAELTGYGLRVKCRRGDTPGEWQAALCP